MLNDMRQVEIDTMYMRVFWSDQVNVDPKTTSNINKLFYALKTIVALKNLFHNYFGMIDHRCIENLVEPWVQTWIIKGMCAMNHVEWDTPFSNCILKLGPKNEETISMYLITILINEETGCWDWKSLDWKAYLAKQNHVAMLEQLFLKQLPKFEKSNRIHFRKQYIKVKVSDYQGTLCILYNFKKPW